MGFFIKGSTGSQTGGEIIFPVDIRMFFISFFFASSEGLSILTECVGLSENEHEDFTRWYLTSVIFFDCGSVQCDGERTRSQVINSSIT